MNCLANTSEACENFIGQLQLQAGNVDEATPNTTRSLLMKDDPATLTPDTEKSLDVVRVGLELSSWLPGKTRWESHQRFCGGVWSPYRLMQHVPSQQ